MNQMPEKLKKYLKEQAEEQNEIIQTYSCDAEIVWYILPKDLPKWIVICSWDGYSENFSLTNITDGALVRLHKIIEEIKR